MCTLAKATVPSREIWRAAAPGANGPSTRSTCGPRAICPSARSIRALVAAALTSRAPKTTWLVSVDSVLKLSVSRFSAVVDSVPGSEKESVYPEPALALRPPSANSAATQIASTTNLFRKHQRASALIAPALQVGRANDRRPDGARQTRPVRRLGWLTDFCSV